MTARSSIADGPSGSLDLPLRISLDQVAPLVPRFLTPRERDLHLHTAVLEVHARRHERETPFTSLAEERVDLFAMQEQLAIAVGVVVLQVPCAYSLMWAPTG